MKLWLPLHKPGVLVHTSNQSTQDVETRGSGIQGHHRYIAKLEASMKFCHKTHLQTTKVIVGVVMIVVVKM